MTTRAPRRFPSARFPATVAPRLLSALAHEHARRPFGPREVRGAAARVVAIARELGLDAVVVRGGLDVGGAELDHVWAVVADRVVDVSLPVASAPFQVVLRAYVAGDLDDEVLDRRAHGYPLSSRVVGEYPAPVSYVGLPVWGSSHGRS